MQFPNHWEIFIVLLHKYVTDSSNVIYFVLKDTSEELQWGALQGEKQQDHAHKHWIERVNRMHSWFEVTALATDG